MPRTPINLIAEKYINNVESDPELSDDAHHENDLGDTIQIFKLASVDPERLFSPGTVFKTFLQNRTEPQVHARHFFILKNEDWLDE